MNVLVMCAALAAAQGGELIERTLAIVGGQAITLTDVRAALTFGLVDVPATDDAVPAATRRLIDRTLILREVQRYSPPEPAGAAIDRELQKIIAHFPKVDAYRTAIETAGMSEARLRAWARDDLRIAAYLDQRFTAAGAPSDDDVSAYFLKHRDEYDQAGTTFAQAAPSIRERLAAERRGELITDWIADLRRRTPVVELFKN